jgi:hypothetical protein
MDSSGQYDWAVDLKVGGNRIERIFGVGRPQIALLRETAHYVVQHIGFGNAKQRR